MDDIEIIEDVIEVLKKLISKAEDVLYLASEDESRSAMWGEELDALDSAIHEAHDWIITHP